MPPDLGTARTGRTCRPDLHVLALVIWRANPKLTSRSSNRLSPLVALALLASSLALRTLCSQGSTAPPQDLSAYGTPAGGHRTLPTPPAAKAPHLELPVVIARPR